MRPLRVRVLALWLLAVSLLPVFVALADGALTWRVVVAMVLAVGAALTSLLLVVRPRAWSLSVWLEQLQSHFAPPTSSTTNPEKE